MLACHCIVPHRHLDAHPVPLPACELRMRILTAALICHVQLVCRICVSAQARLQAIDN